MDGCPIRSCLVLASSLKETAANHMARLSMKGADMPYTIAGYTVCLHFTRAGGWKSGQEGLPPTVYSLRVLGVSRALALWHCGTGGPSRHWS